MRWTAFVMVAALGLAACSTETTAPAVSDLTINAGAFGTALTVTGGYEPELYQTRLTNGLPDSIKLSSDQQAKIKALVDAFNTSTKADRDSLFVLLRKAHDIARTKGSSDALSKILADGAAISARLAAAEAKLKADIDAILTAEQRAWLAAHAPAKCQPDKFVPLSDAQKAQIKALEAAFQTNNKADLDAVRAALDSAAGKSKTDRQAILTTMAPAMARLETARKALKEAITSVLTADQKASGCFPLG